jgi:hypothetical protein
MRMARRAHCDPEVVDGVGTEKIAPPLAEINCRFLFSEAYLEL